MAKRSGASSSVQAPAHGPHPPLPRTASKQTHPSSKSAAPVPTAAVPARAIATSGGASTSATRRSTTSTRGPDAPTTVANTKNGGATAPAAGYPHVNYIVPGLRATRIDPTRNERLGRKLMNATLWPNSPLWNRTEIEHTSYAMWQQLGDFFSTHLDLSCVPQLCICKIKRDEDARDSSPAGTVTQRSYYLVYPDHATVQFILDNRHRDRKFWAANSWPFKYWPRLSLARVIARLLVECSDPWNAC